MQRCKSTLLSRVVPVRLPFAWWSKIAALPLAICMSSA